MKHTSRGAFALLFVSVLTVVGLAIHAQNTGPPDPTSAAITIADYAYTSSATTPNTDTYTTSDPLNVAGDIAAVVGSAGRDRLNASDGETPRIDGTGGMLASSNTLDPLNVSYLQEPSPYLGVESLDSSTPEGHDLHRLREPVDYPLII